MGNGVQQGEILGEARESDRCLRRAGELAHCVKELEIRTRLNDEEFPIRRPPHFLSL